MDNLKNEHISSAEVESDQENQNQQNKQELFTQTPQKQGKQRRTKTDSHKKEHLCDCGRSYLSSAALITHIKQKHEYYPKNNAYLVKKNKTKDSKGSTGQNKGFSHRIAHLNASSIYQDISQFFTKKFKDSAYQKIENTSSPYDWILDVFPRHFFKNGADYFGVLKQLENLINQLKLGDQSSKTQESYSKNNQQESTFHDKQQLQNNSIPKDLPEIAVNKCNNQDTSEMDVVDVYDFMRDLRITSINRIISIFILNVSKLICPAGFTEILVFLTLFRKGLNEKSDNYCVSPLDQVKSNIKLKKEAVLIKNQISEDQQGLKSAREFKTKIKIEERQQDEQDEGQARNDQNHQESMEFCSQNSGEFIGEFANKFITELLPGYFENAVINTNELHLLGAHEEGMKNSCYILQLFINWMYVFKFSSSEVSFFTELEEQQEIIPFAGEIHNRKQRKYDNDPCNQPNDDMVNQKCNSQSFHLQGSLQKKSLNFLDRIQSADNLNQQKITKEIPSNAIKSFDEGPVLEKNNIKNVVGSYNMEPQSAVTSTTFAGAHGSGYNSTSYAYRGNSTSYAQGGNSTSYAQRGNSTTFFSQPSSVQGIGSTCFNFGSQQMIADSSTPRISSISYPSPFYNDGCGGQTLFAAQPLQPCFTFINQAQFMNPVQFYGVAYGQPIDYSMQRVPLQYYYSQNRWSQQNVSYLGGGEQFQGLH